MRRIIRTNNCVLLLIAALITIVHPPPLAEGSPLGFPPLPVTRGGSATTMATKTRTASKQRQRRQRTSGGPELTGNAKQGIKQTEKILHLLHIFTADLILQVFGGAGAIWGFSEVLGLRTPETVWFWRPTAQFFGTVFFARWIVQLDAHIKKENIEFFPKQRN